MLVRAAILGSVAGTFSAEALAHANLRTRALTLLQVVPQWARLLVWPAHLRADYSPNEFIASTFFGPREALGAALLILAGIVIWRSRRRLPTASFGVAWCLVGLLPVSNLLVVTGVLIAERTLFLPSIGFLLAAGGAVEALLQHVLVLSRGPGRECSLPVGRFS